MNLFVYGTLLVPEIWNTVSLCPEASSTFARLRGHRIQRVKGGDFPAIVSDPGADVSGRIMFDLPPAAVTRLDQYEDTFYERVNVSVETPTGAVDAQTYRLPAHLERELLSEDPWTLEWFESEALERFWNRIFGRRN